ncbi:MAG: hypothetical protein EI684_23450 [Candidatus Viridilinea halotolerans]|uniref:Glycosyltransferase RgtA/B/C/D-like domain-containing protein n=1 Tax=Candidatus Viridilinea halotolerans TaxID=2491704 RepID=A0A426TQ64_9CHLR|nr:MAG: hypothetical protein EI684_23450 [Candidatus Viridilinea halotolerans]
MVSLFFAALLLLLLLYLPGWAWSRRFGVPADELERHFERVAVGALWSGWLTLVLAALGIFTIWLYVALTLGLVAALVFRSHPRSPPPAPLTQRWELVAFGALLLVTLLLVVRPFETVLGVRDAGVYANTGLAIARTGSLVQDDPLLARWGQEAEASDAAVAGPARQVLTNYLISQPRERYIASRLRAAGFFVNEGELAQGRVVPQGLHLLPAWIGLLTALGGPYFGLFAPGLLGLLGAWSVGMLGRRLAGPWVGLLAMVFLALNGVQIWFARYSTAETTAQFLIWVGLYFFAVAFGGTERRGDGEVGGEEARGRSGEEAGGEEAVTRPVVTALLAGVAIGQVALTRIDFFLLGPVLAFLLYVGLTRRWQVVHTALAVGLGLMLLHAGLHVLFVARAYFFDTAHERLLRDYALVALLAVPFLTPVLRTVFLEGARSALVRPLRLPGGVELDGWVRLGLEVGLLLALVVALLVLRRHAHWLLRMEAALLAQRRRWLNGLLVGILLLGGYAYLVRPAILDSDILFNTRGGWGDPLRRAAALVAADVRAGRMSIEEARNQAGVVLQPGPLWEATPAAAATAALREQLLAERGPWTGPLSNQTTNWLRVQGYVGAPIRIPLRLWYNEYGSMSWWQRITVDPTTLTSEPAPLNPKYLIPLANLVRVGWYLSPLGLVLGIVGYALWLRRGLNSASWLFLSVALVGTLFYVRQTYGTSDQHYIYILRRFVPITYPALSLGMAFALVALAGWRGPRTSSSPAPEQGNAVEHSSPPPAPEQGNAIEHSSPSPATRERGPGGEGHPSHAHAHWQRGRVALATSLALLLTIFFLFTNRPIIGHVEYRGALTQLDGLAAQFTPGRDVLLMRGGAPIHAEARDVPDMVATPLRFGYGLDAFAVKSTRPGEYANDLAAAARRLYSQGHTVYLLLSASGGSFALPGFALEPVGTFTLDVPEFEQLTDQKPRNVSALSLSFAIYRLVPGDEGRVATAVLPLTPADFAAQVVGFHRPELRRDGTPYAWSNGDAILRLPWATEGTVRELELTLAGGERPAHLGPAEVCLSALPEDRLWPSHTGEGVDLGCFVLTEDATAVVVHLDAQALPPTPSGTLLLRLRNRPWIPALEDARQNDRRNLGVQMEAVRWR